jgi:hypothetical protein
MINELILQYYLENSLPFDENNTHSNNKAGKYNEFFDLGQLREIAMKYIDTYKNTPG